MVHIATLSLYYHCSESIRMKAMKWLNVRWSRSGWSRSVSAPQAQFFQEWTMTFKDEIRCEGRSFVQEPRSDFQRGRVKLSKSSIGNNIRRESETLWPAEDFRSTATSGTLLMVRIFNLELLLGWTKPSLLFFLIFFFPLFSPFLLLSRSFLLGEIQDPHSSRGEL